MLMVQGLWFGVLGLWCGVYGLVCCVLIVGLLLVAIDQSVCLAAHGVGSLGYCVFWCDRLRCVGVWVL